MKIRMTGDSTCDLTPEWIRKYNIGIAPLSVIIDGEVFHDGVDVTYHPGTFSARLRPASLSGPQR